MDIFSNCDSTAQIPLQFHPLMCCSKANSDLITVESAFIAHVAGKGCVPSPNTMDYFTFE